MTAVDFEAFEYHADGELRRARFRFEGSPEAGWVALRDGEPHLELGPGYVLLRALACGVCSTDLARRHLPFPLPQITGHEVVAEDAEHRRYALEINASHRARGLSVACPLCDRGLDKHCPERKVLGIHDLPGGFGPYVLAPVRGVVPLPDEIPTPLGVLVEPLAAALNAVTTIAPRAGDRIAVIGPRKLGMLLLAALDSHRRRSGAPLHLIAVARRPSMLDLARAMGADEVRGAGEELAPVDVAIDTSGAPEGLELAARIARREVHIKSTHGQRAAGLSHVTEFVVDELALARLCPENVPDAARVVWLADEAVPGWLESRAQVLREPEAGADLVVVGSPAEFATAVRPRADRQTSLVRPRGRILVAQGGSERETLLDACRARDLLVTSSRCGDLAHAADVLRDDPALLRRVSTLVTHVHPADQIRAAFEDAASPHCVKAVVTHEA